VFDISGPLTATPLQLPDDCVNLETLATVASNAQTFQVPQVYHVQCQTPSNLPIGSDFSALVRNKVLKLTEICAIVRSKK
jgi:hypothetical protein